MEAPERYRSKRKIVIVARKLPYFIDMETCFFPCELSLKSTDAINIEASCVSIYSKNKHFIDSLLRVRKNSVTGKAFLTFEEVYVPNKNILYFAKNDLLSSYMPNYNLMFEGFRKALDVLSKQISTIEKWFKLPQVNSMYVRIVPFATAEFELWMKENQEEKFNKLIFRSKMFAINTSLLC